MRIGIFGGTFDPVHYGHLLLAECCREQARLDRVWFLPCAVSPWKQLAHPASGAHRRAMLELAIANHPALEIEPLELERGGISYTAQTLQMLHDRQKDAEFFWLMGADTLADLPRWRDPATICRLAVPLAVQRGGASVVDFDGLAGLVTPERLEYFRSLPITMPQVDISSSDIRQRVAMGRSIRYRTPPEVIRYIVDQGLYRAG